MPIRKFVIEVSVGDGVPSDGNAAADEFCEAVMFACDLTEVPAWVESIDGMDPVRESFIGGEHG